MPFLLILFVLGIVLAFFIVTRGKRSSVQEVTEKATNIISGGAGFNFPEDVPGRENLAKLRQGCPFKDCIPSIDEPKFESISEADSWLEDENIVFALDYKGESKAYPQRILNWHEILNDQVSGDPLTVTFCPLCGSALAFERRVDGQTLEFGVSGKLLNNDLIMYDRETESLWEQITGEAIVGDFFGKRLTQVPLSGMRWSQFKEEFPQGEVLSQDTGFSRDYSRYPYGNYEQDVSVLFPVEGGVDTTIHPKTVVYGIEVGKNYKAYEEEKLEKEGEITDTVGGVEIKVTFKNGKVEARNLEADEELVATRLFWFAWKSFRPETELY